MKEKIFESDNVKKFVFEKEDAVFESVMYKYPDYKTRTVMCVSVQSGCPVGCEFCGTGKHFVRNLEVEEIIAQVVTLKQHAEREEGLDNLNSACAKFQIMFMSMGEPFLNYPNVKEAIIELHKMYPNADLLVSTVGINKGEEIIDFIRLSSMINKIGLQLSLHNPFDEERKKLIPYKNLLSIQELRDFGMM